MASACQLDRGPALPRAPQPVAPRPVLIGGCPRSGTTLLGAMLGNGPERLTVPESTFKFRLLAGLDDAGRLDARDAAARLSADRLFGLWNVEVPAMDSEVWQYDDLMARLVAALADQWGRPVPRTWIDHTPANILHVHRLADLLPDAQFIHIVRDGRGVLASLLDLDWGPNTVQGVARWWSSWIAHGLAAERSLGTGRVLLVHFEDLVKDTDATLQRVCDFIGAPHEPAMARSREYAVSPYTREMHRLVSQPPRPDRAEAWRGVLSDYQVSAFERLTGDLLGLMGYDPVYGPRASLGTRGQRLAEFTTDVVRRATGDRLRRARRRRRIPA